MLKSELVANIGAVLIMGTARPFIALGDNQDSLYSFSGLALREDGTWAVYPAVPARDLSLPRVREPHVSANVRLAYEVLAWMHEDATLEGQEALPLQRGERVVRSELDAVRRRGRHEPTQGFVVGRDSVKGLRIAWAVPR